MYINPNYYNPAMQNPLYQNQYQQQMIYTPPTLPGKSVNDFSEIMASDVPMDGRAAIFPKSDYSELQIKTWGRDGKINTVIYRPFQSEQAESNEQIESTSLKEELIAAMNDRFEHFEKEICEKLSKKNTKTSEKGDK